MIIYHTYAYKTTGPCATIVLMSKITKYLNQLITGNVYDSPKILDFYSTDRSILKVTPKFVAVPESTDDLQKLLKFFDKLTERDLNIPVAIRGSGLGEMGGALSSGVVISTEKLNHLMEIDTREKLVRVQAGITLKELNTALMVSGLTLPIKANENRTIGGLIAGFPTDDFAGKYGGIMNYVERAEIVLANGERIQTNRVSKLSVSKKLADKSLEGSIYYGLSKILDENSALVSKLQQNHTSAAGYPTAALVKRRDAMNLLPAFFGSEGTLGVISEVILKAVPIKKQTARAIITFPKLSLATKFLEPVAALKPRELNLCDIRILKAAEENGKTISSITKTLEEGFAVYVSFDEKVSSNFKKLAALSKNLARSTKLITEDNENSALFDEYENSILNYLNLPKNGECVPLLTDFYLPNHNLLAFLEDLKTLEKKLKIDLPLFGSYANSNYNIRPVLNPMSLEFSDEALTLLKAGTFIINRGGGSIVGGTPEGRVKALVTNPSLPEDEKLFYARIKDLFDPHHILNPEIKLGTNQAATVRCFRTTTQGQIVV